MDLSLHKISRLTGSVRLVGSKSLTNRALLLSALAQGTTTLRNILISDDSKVMLNALKILGVTITHPVPDDESVVSVTGLGGTFKASEQDVTELFLGNAGTAMRPLCAALALSSGKFKLTGEPRMYERPIGELVSALRQLGARVEYLGTEGYPPLLITGAGCGGVGCGGSGCDGSDCGGTGGLTKLEVAGDVSSQFISALLMVGALTGIELKVRGRLISRPYVNLTCRLLERFGVVTENHDFERFVVRPQLLVSPGSYLVEGDATGATYFLAGAAVSGEITVEGIGRGSVQGDARFIEVLQQMGAVTEVQDDCLKVKSPAPGKLKGIALDLNDMPDAAMTLVPLAAFCEGRIALYNIGSWRVKETDRIAALATEMRKLGCKTEEGPDYLIVDAHTPEYDAKKQDQSFVPEFDTYNDHRMAMSLSLIALDRRIIIRDPGCVAKTFPDYFERLATVTVPATA